MEILPCQKIPHEEIFFGKLLAEMNFRDDELAKNWEKQIPKV